MTTLWIALMTGCGGAEHDHAHGPGTHEHHDAPAPAAPAALTAVVARRGGHVAALGDATAEVVLTDGTLALYVFDASGAAVAPEGDARVVLTPHDGAEQRLVLEPSDGRWVAEAVGSEAGGLAVVQVAVGGRDQTARIAWGESANHTHDHGEHGHDH